MTTTANPISDVLSAPLGLDWTVEGVAEKLLMTVAGQPGKEEKEFVYDSMAATSQQSRRLIRPLLACLANMSAAESGTQNDIFGGRLSFKRSGPEGPVEISGQFENKQGDVRVMLRRSAVQSVDSTAAAQDHDSGNGDDFDDPLDPFHQPGDDEPLRGGELLLNRFRLIRQFSGNRFSRVWLAWETVLRRFVVLKFVDAELLNEGRRAAAVSGAVIRVHDYNTAIPGHPFLVMEAALGGPVGNLAKEWSAAPALLAAKFIPVVETLARAHLLGIVHRDLKPANLLLWVSQPACRDDVMPPLPDVSGLDPRAFEVRVTDWGLAIDSNGSDSHGGGTIGFAAPEQWSQPASPAADLFGIAATLYYLLAGEHVMKTSREFLIQLSRDPSSYQPPPAVHLLNPRVDRRLARIIMKSLAADPAARHSSAGAFAEELSRWLNGYSISGDGRGLKAALWAQRRFPWVALGLSAVVLGVLGGATAVRDLENRAAVAEQQATIDRLELQKVEQREFWQRQLNNAELIREQRLRNTENLAAARTAARRGDWKTALSLYEKVVPEIEPATVRQVRVERLIGYFATNDEPTLLAELDQLEADPYLGPMAIRVKLIRGIHMMCDHAQAKKGREALRQVLVERVALSDIERNAYFSEADALYAEALLAETPKPVVDLLKKALAADALHYPAHAALVVALIAGGDVPEAMSQADRLAGLFPDSPIPAFVRAVAATVAGDRNEMRVQASEFGRKSHADAKRLARYLELLADSIDLMDKYNPQRGLPPSQLFALMGKLSAMQAEASPALQPVAFPVPTVNLFQSRGQKVLELLLQGPGISRFELSQLPKLDRLAQGLETLAHDYPEAVIHLLLATNRLMAAGISMQGNNLDETLRRLRETSDLAYRAAQQPTMAPRANPKFFATVVGVSGDVALLRLAPDADFFLTERLGGHLHALLVQGRARPDERDAAIELIIRLLVSPLTEPQKARWKQESAEAYRRQTLQLYRLAHVLLDDWAAEAARQADPARKKSEARASATMAQLERWARTEGVAEAIVPPSLMAPPPRAK